MSDIKEGIERREHRRYSIRDHMFISNTSKNGPVIDVSLGGLAFQYIERKEMREETIKFGTLIGGDFCLSQAPVETVAETRFVEDDTVHCRCSLKFGALSKVENKKLQRFIASRALDDTKKNAHLINTETRRQKINATLA